MVWACVKARLRRMCVFSIHARESLNVELLTVPIAFFRRASRHCFRFMSGYRHGLTGNLLDYTQRKYKGHRAIPNFVIIIMIHIVKRIRGLESLINKPLLVVFCVKSFAVHGW
jgi:hypothetical protein